MAEMAEKSHLWAARAMKYHMDNRIVNKHCGGVGMSLLPTAAGKGGDNEPSAAIVEGRLQKSDPWPRRNRLCIQLLRDNHDAGDFLQLFSGPVEYDFGGITGGTVVRMGAVTRTEQLVIAEPKVEIVQYELCDLLVESLELFVSHS
jgi:hypothetical protein